MWEQEHHFHLSHTGHCCEAVQELADQQRLQNLQEEQSRVGCSTAHKECSIARTLGSISLRLPNTIANTWDADHEGKKCDVWNVEMLKCWSAVFHLKNKMQIKIENLTHIVIPNGSKV